ncbi:MMPL family transporter [Thermocatellispora tengchongensis]|uniref:MMPL family transporter n=1 Tax=Thermocatellispora tengchongensis TaxID=1073253 RepID=UPI0035E402E9
MYAVTAGSAALLTHRAAERLRLGDSPATAVRAAVEQTGHVMAATAAASAAACTALLLIPPAASATALAAGLAGALAVQALTVLGLVPPLLVLTLGRVRPSGVRRRSTRTPAPRWTAYGRLLGRRPGPAAVLALTALGALVAGGMALGPEPVPGIVAPIAGVCATLVLALATRTLLAPALLTAAALAVATTAAAATDPAGALWTPPGGRPPGTGADLTVAVFALATTLTAGMLVLARIRQTARTGRDPRRATALGVRYAGPAALALSLLAGTLTAAGHGVLTGAVTAAGGCLVALVLVPAVTTLLGRHAWWPESTPPFRPRVDQPTHPGHLIGQLRPPHGIEPEKISRVPGPPQHIGPPPRREHHDHPDLRVDLPDPTDSGTEVTVA